MLAFVTLTGPSTQIIGTIKRKPASALDGQTDEEAAGAKQTQDTSVIHDLLHLKGKDALTLAHALKDLAKGEWSAIDRWSMCTAHFKLRFLPQGSP